MPVLIFLMFFIFGLEKVTYGNSVQALQLDHPENVDCIDPNSEAHLQALSQNTQPQSLNPLDRIGLIRAAIHGQYLQAQEILNSSTPYQDLADRDKYAVQRALNEACKAGHLQIIDLLLKYGAQVNLVVKGNSPFAIAIEKKQYQVAEALLDRGADVNLAGAFHRFLLNINKNVSLTAKEVALLHHFLEFTIGFNVKWNNSSLFEALYDRHDQSFYDRHDQSFNGTALPPDELVQALLEKGTRINDFLAVAFSKNSVPRFRAYGYEIIEQIRQFKSLLHPTDWALLKMTKKSVSPDWFPFCGITSLIGNLEDRTLAAFYYDLPTLPFRVVADLTYVPYQYLQFKDAEKILKLIAYATQVQGIYLPKFIKDNWDLFEFRKVDQGMLEVYYKSFSKQIRKSAYSHGRKTLSDLQIVTAIEHEAKSIRNSNRFPSFKKFKSGVLRRLTQ